MAIREAINRADGHIYYVIDSEGHQKIVMGIAFLDTYDQLADVRGQPGLWFVRDAACDETGQHGDPTVHEGWAIYTWDAWFQGERGGWRKVAEQESVDGPWGIDEKILKMLVKKTEFNSAMEKIDERIKKVEESVLDLENRMSTVEEAIADLLKYKHWHDNKAILDAITAKYGQLIFRGVPISGNCFFYNNIQDGKLIWIDPTDPEAEPKEIGASYRLAEKFCATTMAWHGMTLEVAEADGSTTKFEIVQDNDVIGAYHDLVDKTQIMSNRRYWKCLAGAYEEITAEEAAALLDEPVADVTVHFTEGALKAVCVSTSVAGAWGGIIYVEKLPEANVSFDGRGMWCPTEDDGVHTPFHVYRSKYGEWVDILVENGSGLEIPFAGPAFTLAYCEDDPIMPRKLVHLKWSEPETKTYLDKPIRWGKTYLVKKANSVPTSIEDGVVVRAFSDPSKMEKEIIDINWFHDGPTFYRLFAETVSGTKYIPTDAVEPKYLEWENVFNLIEKDLAKDVFKVGDSVVLPVHPKFGAIECEVISVTHDAIRVATKNVLEMVKFGTNNTFSGSVLESWLHNNFDGYSVLKLSEDRCAVAGKQYFVFENGFNLLTIGVGENMPEGVKVYEPETGELSKGIFKNVEIPEFMCVGWDNISKEKFFKTYKDARDWWTQSPTLGGHVITGNNPNGTLPSSTLGAVVVFTIARPN